MRVDSYDRVVHQRRVLDIPIRLPSKRVNCRLQAQTPQDDRPQWIVAGMEESQDKFGPLVEMVVTTDL